MSDRDRVSGREGCGGDAAAYALGALDPAEADAFVHHLRDCDLCADDLTRFGSVVDGLAMSAPQFGAPRALRGRVIGAVRREPRESGGSGRRRRWAPMALLTRARLGRPALTAAGAVGLASVTLAIATLVPGRSQGVHVLPTRVVNSSGRAQVRLVDGRAELIVRDFPAPAVGHIYEVWLKRPGQTPEPTRVLFSVSGQGTGDIGVLGGLEGVAEILVTEEPAGGSRTPTRQPVIVARLT